MTFGIDSQDGPVLPLCEEDFPRIEALQMEALERGDEAMVRLCNKALRGDDKAWLNCLQVLKAREQGVDIWSRLKV